jgi:NTP pyrophosphatase (non-canonical NTP hydrolase)
MGKFKDEGDSALALAEECAEIIQIVNKMKRFNGSWNEIPPGKDKTRWEELNDEMTDLIYQWGRLLTEYDAIHEEPEPLDESYKGLQ